MKWIEWLAASREIQDYNEFVIKNGLTEKSDKFFHDKVLLTPSISKIIEFWFKNFRTNRAFNKSFLIINYAEMDPLLDKDRKMIFWLFLVVTVILNLFYWIGENGL